MAVISQEPERSDLTLSRSTTHACVLCMYVLGRTFAPHNSTQNKPRYGMPGKVVRPAPPAAAGASWTQRKPSVAARSYESSIR